MWTYLQWVLPPTGRCDTTVYEDNGVYTTRRSRLAIRRVRHVMCHAMKE